MSAKKPADPHAPLAGNAMKADLKALKAKLDAEEKARAAEAAAKNKPAPKPAPAPPPKRSSSVEVWRPEDLDQRLFDVAMSGVQRLPAKGPTPTAHTPRAPKADPAAKNRQAHAEGGVSITARWSPDGTVTGARRGCEFALEALGRFAAPGDSIDLHGVDPASVPLRVQDFVRTRRARGLRCVKVITGYGKNSPDGASVLLDIAVSALSTPPATGELDAYTSAPAELGGRGAILVALRG
jgi:DNA-nicking Smr family endonuclease